MWKFILCTARLLKVGNMCALCKWWKISEIKSPFSTQSLLRTSSLPSLDWATESPRCSFGQRPNPVFSFFFFREGKSFSILPLLFRRWRFSSLFLRSYFPPFREDAKRFSFLCARHFLPNTPRKPRVSCFWILNVTFLSVLFIILHN